MRRRAFGAGLAAAVASLGLTGHTPYGQWVVYRRKHLLIGCHREDPQTYRLAKAVVAHLERHLPEARARPARAPTAGRLAALLGTDQLEMAVLSATDARAMVAGTGGFGPYGAVPLRLVAELSDRLLVAHAGFPDRHARLVSAAIIDGELARHPAPDHDPPLAWHPGTAEFLGGAPPPAAQPAMPRSAGRP